MKAQPAPEKIYCSHCNLRQFNRMQLRCIHCDKFLKGEEHENKLGDVRPTVPHPSSDSDGLLHLSAKVH